MQKSLIHSVVKEILSRYYPEIHQFIYSVAKELLSQNDHLKERNSKIRTYTQKFDTIPGLPGTHMKS